MTYAMLTLYDLLFAGIFVWLICATLGLFILGRTIRRMTKEAGEHQQLSLRNGKAIERMIRVLGAMEQREITRENAIRQKAESDERERIKRELRAEEPIDVAFDLVLAAEALAHPRAEIEPSLFHPNSFVANALGIKEWHYGEGSTMETEKIGVFRRCRGVPVDLPPWALRVGSAVQPVRRDEMKIGDNGLALRFVDGKDGRTRLADEAWRAAEPS